MIHILADRHDGFYTALTIKGHAVGLCNALSDLAGLETIQVENNMISIRCEEPDDLVQVILTTGMIQFKTVEVSYSDYIDIQITEV